MEAGLSAVLVQDLGVLALVREHFPHLAVHASTQMAVTGIHGARMLRQMGVTRIVPARELSLAELRAIRNEAGIEVEAFIHGAMCYSYSGLCLFSGMIGGRSGNRGRCAQACRLPYRAEGETGEGAYRLSMKDLYGLRRLPQLIDAGIDAFKIEGRMKPPAYVAGVTGIYRKYIDRYTQDPLHFTIDAEDEALLQSLYLRTGVQDGYFERHNGKELVTMESPAYNPTDKALLEAVRDTCLPEERRLRADMHLILDEGKEARLTVTGNGRSVTVTGDVVQEAKTRPLAKEEILRQMEKLGDTFFAPGRITVEAGERIFLPVSSLNALRRQGIEALTQALLEEAV
ncbi:MAG: U32 family peptidase [Lachnospiraceae bacterium]|nr:U32 family peptidase [Lachnospiraceae bacterium]